MLNNSQNPTSSDDDDRRAQAYVTEALFTVILLSSVLFLATTWQMQEPLLSSEDRDDQVKIEDDLQTVLDQTKQDGTLKRALLTWDDSEDQFYEASNEVDEQYYKQLPERARFTDRINAFLDRHSDLGQIRVNVKMTPARNATAPGVGPNRRVRPETVPWFVDSSAGFKMVTADTQLTLYGSDEFDSVYYYHRTSHTPANATGPSSDDVYLSDDHSYPVASSRNSVDDGDVYNVVNVRVVAWFN